MSLSVELALRKAQSRIKNGDLASAEAIYKEILAEFPKNKRAIEEFNKLKADSFTKGPSGSTPAQEKLQELINLYNQGQLQEVIQRAKPMVTVFPKDIFLWNLLGAANAGLHRYNAAIESYKEAVKIRPDYAECYNNMGNALQKKGDLAAAIESYKEAVKIRPDYAEGYNNMGNALQEKGNLDAAIESYQKAVKIKPNYADAYYNMGIALNVKGERDTAIESYKKAVKIAPNYAEAHSNLASALTEKGDPISAIENCNHAIRVKPDYAEAHNNLGNALHSSGNLRAAIVSYNRAIEIRPDYAEAHNNLGVALAEKGDITAAIECYNCAIDIKPDYANAYDNLGVSLRIKGDVRAAIESCKRSLQINPDYAKAHHNMGNALLKNADPEAAIKSYQQALEIEPDFVPARSQKLYQQAIICDWKAIEKDRNLIPALGIATDHIAPFTMLPLEDHPTRHLKRSALFAKDKFKGKSAALPKITRPPQNSDRLRLGYFSGDFHAHPVMRLSLKMFELHDRANFEIHAFSCGPDNNDDMRDQLIKNFDAFHDVRDMPDQEIAELARKKGIDIAIDLTGYTENARAQILAYRAAPIQVSYLGYPGSMGADFIDYLIADCTLIPTENQKFYSEKIVHLPNCYQISSHSNPPPNMEGSRSELGLPEDGFVFCCFNDHYKITPREFDIWMRLLGKVQGSVLWLRRSNKSSEANLKKEAQVRAVASSRLIFAEKCEYSEYLMRMTKADLFLDTFNYNAGAMANDALWSGLPILTKQGESYVARMASSLLNAIDLPELITSNENDYEQIALDLATHPNKLESLKAKLSINRDNTSLFDTARSTKNIETAYAQMHEKYLANQNPEHLFIKE